jgi:biotin transport system substrate-specific component
MAAHLVLLTIGALYLGSVIGFTAAFWAGFAPFIIGSVLKSALVATLIKATDGVRRCLPVLR